MPPETPNWTDIAGVIIAALTFLTIGVAAIQLIFHSRQMHREFENLYVARYWELMDRRSRSFVVDRIPTEKDRPIIRAYLQLSEDEIDLRRLGRVTDNTWRFWADAILEQCSTAGYREELELAPATDYPNVRHLIETSGEVDPLSAKWGWRKRHGL